MNYSETQQKQILREMESDLLALVAVDLNTEHYEVIYSDESYKKFKNRYQGEEFFRVWKSRGLQLIHPDDRMRMELEISKKHLKSYLESSDVFISVCRFLTQKGAVYCRIKAAEEVHDPGVCIISIRNIDNDFLRQREQEKRFSEIQQDLNQAKMKTFIRQMQSHFIFNALASIREVILDNPEYAAEMLYDFTTYLRANIRALSNDGLVAFSRELEIIKAYMNIEKMRFGERLAVQYDIAFQDFEIVPLSIQPLMENAVKHGIYQTAKAKGVVTLRARKSADGILVQVEDNGPGFDAVSAKKKSSEGDSVGLSNLSFRLKTLMNADVIIEGGKEGGTCVTVKIPNCACPDVSGT